MPLAVRRDSPHVRDVVGVVFAWVFLGVLAQDVDDFATTVVGLVQFVSVGLG